MNRSPYSRHSIEYVKAPVCSVCIRGVRVSLSTPFRPSMRYVLMHIRPDPSLRETVSTPTSRYFSWFFQRPDWHVCFPDFEGLSVSSRTREAAMDTASFMLLRRLAMAAQQGKRIQKWRWITVPETGILVVIYPESRRRVKVTRQTELI